MVRCRIKKLIATVLTMALLLSVAYAVGFGSGGAQLSTGKYSVPISLRNAGNIANPSAAAAAFPATAELTINEDGSAVLTTTLHEVKMGSISDMAHDFKIYQENSVTGETVDAEVVETTVYTDSSGNTKTVPGKISFVIPDVSLDGVYLNMYVDAMGYAPDAYLAIDYTGAASPGTSVTYSGTAKVTQFGKYDVNVQVTVTDGVISGVDIAGDNFGGTYADFNKSKLQMAIDGLKNWWNGKKAGQENAKELYQVDAVSSATVSSNTIRDAVMNALSVTYEEEVINVPSSVEPGVYEVEVSCRTDIVEHYLTGGDRKEKAVLTVSKDNAMTLDFEIINDTPEEPLYVLGFNGCYEDNDRTKALTLAGSKAVMGTTGYSDEYFALNTPVVTHLTVPLSGELTKEYNINTYLYVPAMNNLNGVVSGVEFEHGKFNVDSFVKIYWDSLKAKAPDISKNGKYIVEVALWNASSDQPSMGNKAFTDNNRAIITTRGGVSTIRIETNPVTITPFYSALENARFKNADGITQYVTPVAKRDIVATDGTDEYPMEYLRRFEFVLPDMSEYIDFAIKVPHTPMDSISPSGYIDARLKIDWSTLREYGCDITLESVTQTGGAVTVKTDNIGDKTTAIAYLVLYDSEKKLISTQSKAVTIDSGAGSILFEGVDTSGAATVKAMLWNSAGTLSPAAEAVIK